MAPTPRPQNAGERMVIARMKEQETKQKEQGELLQKVSDNVDKIAEAIGTAHEDGRGGVVATGLQGRVYRNEQLTASMQETMKRFIWLCTGFLTAGGILSGVIWWLIAEKLAKVLH